jgi:CubicO group peptidase (beta-lactamase class C family)
MLRRTGLVSPRVEILEQIDDWPPDRAAVGVVGLDGVVASHGDDAAKFRWASVTKLVTALAVLVAAEEGVVELDEPAGPSGSTVRHLLSHASGLPFDGTIAVSRPGERRIYSNTGYTLLAQHLATKSELPFEEYVTRAVFEPLELGVDLREEVEGASGIYGTLLDLLSLAQELLRPTLLAAETFAEATQAQFPGLVGVLPEFGRQDPNDWGLGFELRDAKSPHWTGTRNSSRTFGHFGGSGSFLWVDPDEQLAVGFLCDREFDDWADEAKRLWPALSDAVLSAAAGR